MAFNISNPVSRTLLSDLGATRDLMSDKDYIIVEGVITVLSVALALVGVLGNAVSIITFVSMASKDGVTVTFLFMAAADLIYLVTVTAMGVSFLLLSVEVISGYTIWFPVEPYGVYGFLAMSGRYPYEASNLATTCLSVARCLCVARPLLYRSSFTGNAALCITLIFSVFSIACFTPVLALMEMKVQYRNYINASRPSMWISPTREKVKDVIWTVTDAFIPMATQVIIAFCVIVMNRSLKSASEFRQKSCSGLTRRGKYLKNFEVARHSHAITTSAYPNPREAAGKLMSGKDLQVVQQVLLISVIYIISNTPIIVINFAGMYNKEFALQKTYHNLFLSMIGVKHLFQTINSSFNVLIYFKYNTKFRHTLLRVRCTI